MMYGKKKMMYKKGKCLEGAKELMYKKPMKVELDAKKTVKKLDMDYPKPKMKMKY